MKKALFVTIAVLLMLTIALTLVSCGGNAPVDSGAPVDSEVLLGSVTPI